MPYFITDDAEGCDGFATIKEDGEVIGCHQTKQEAINQMIAVSIAEDIEPGGERMKHKKKMKKPAYRAPVGSADKFTTEQEALDRADEIGCEGTHTIDEDGQTVYMPCSTHAVYDSLVNNSDEDRAPAPKKEQIKGSDTNKPGSAKGSGSDIVFSEATTTGLKNKVSEHNEKMQKAGKPDYTKTTLGTLKSVYRRGSGAYSTSFRPGVSRAAWSMARVNAFLYLLRNGRPANPKYITDNDLLPKGHPKSSRDLRIESGPLAVIADIDGTLIEDNQRVDKVYEYLDDMTDTSIFIVTARNEGQRESTVRQLNDLDIDYDELFMKPEDDDETAQAYKKMIAEKLLSTYNVILAIDDDSANRQAFRELGITALDVSDVPDVVPSEEEEERQVNLTPPVYMRAAARRGLELNRQGFGGDGLTDKTKQEARNMADGRVSEDKWRRIAPWIARHLVDLDAPSNSNQSDPGFPGAGLVAHLLWGSGPSKTKARRTMEYAEGVVNRLNAEEEQSRWSSVNVNLSQPEEGKSMTKVERRVKNDINFELRMDDAESDGMRFSGYAAVFNSESEPLPFIETIAPGAFRRSLKSRNEVKLFKNHNMDEVLASTRSKTLKLIEDEKGLLAEATLPDTTAGRDLAVLMKRGDVHSMSFGFSVPRGGDKYSDDGKTRTLKEIRLHEVSIVTGFPAYQSTTASVRSLDILATRTQVDVDELADVMLKLESGETLKDAEASLITEVVDKLREDKPSEKDLLNIKRQQLDLLYKMV
jgi:HK97 family phage prohead protease